MAERFTEELLKEVWNDAMQKQAEPYVMRERAAIVAWLMREEEGYPSSEYSGFAAMIREDIEAGRHLK